MVHLGDQTLIHINNLSVNPPPSPPLTLQTFCLFSPLLYPYYIYTTCVTLLFSPYDTRLTFRTTWRH